MSERDASGSSGDDGTGGASEPPSARGHPGADAGGGSLLRDAVRWAVTSGAVATVGSLGTLVAGLRALRRREWRSALVRLFVGGLLGAVAVAQRRSAAQRSRAGPRVEEPGAAGTAPGVEEPTADAVPEVEEPGGTAAEAPPTAPTEEVPEAPPAAEAGELEVLGAAAFNAHSGRVPAPQVAFNRELLSPGAEVHWGVREDDAAVVCSLDFDAVDRPEGLRYVGSSETEYDGREVRVPDPVLDHWDVVAGGGTAVTSGTDLVFVTSEDLAGAGHLLVVPEQWREDVLGEGETESGTGEEVGTGEDEADVGGETGEPGE